MESQICYWDGKTLSGPENPVLQYVKARGNGDRHSALYLGKDNICIHRSDNTEIIGARDTILPLPHLPPEPLPGSNWPQELSVVFAGHWLRVTLKGSLFSTAGWEGDCRPGLISSVLPDAFVLCLNSLLKG